MIQYTMRNREQGLGGRATMFPMKSMTHWLLCNPRVLHRATVCVGAVVVVDILLLLLFAGAGDPGPLLMPWSVPHDQGVRGEIQSGRFQRIDLHKGNKLSIQCNIASYRSHRVKDVLMAVQQTGENKV